MRIQSKFKDYYDFISHRYGSDPGCTYLRGKIDVNGVDWSKFPLGSAFCSTLAKSVSDYEMEFVVAGPHVVPILCRQVAVYGCDPNDRRYQEIATPLRPAHGHLLIQGMSNRPASAFPRELSKSALEDLIRLVGHPVFRVRDRAKYGTIVVAENTPILKDIGFPSLFAPEVIWQDIYTTLTSVLRRDPDKAPPVEVSEKIRIEYAGFDLKSSFRHPVNPKKVK